MITKTLAATWRRVRHADVVDWLFAMLFLVVGVAGGVLVWEHYQTEPTIFGAVSFAAPTVISDADGAVPSAAGTSFTNLPSPAISWNDEVPLKVSRIIDCAAHDCPSVGIPVLVDLRWQEVTTTGGTAGRSFDQLLNYETVYEEGVDYRKGTIVAVTNQLPNIPVPEEVKFYLQRENKTVSAWRIEGYVTPELPNASVATWVTDVIHVYDPSK